MKKRVLVTGGTGFLGRHLARVLKPKFDVVLTGRNNKQNMLASQMTDCEVIPMDVASIESVRDAVVTFRPEIIVHAAATKFVDLAEREPMECVDVNVIGSQNVLRVALDKEVESVIGISTDKAAPPVRNTYGLTKATMERMFCGINKKTDCKAMCVRYGNVAWSTGSVLPIWKSMFEKNGVIGSTGPEMTRFFFTVNEAVQLILTAMDNIDDLQGTVLSRTMKSAKIEDILQVWVEEKGGSWEKIDGRPGERNCEYLIGDTELPYTQKRVYDEIEHFIIDFNKKAAVPMTEPLTSDNANRLSRQEIVSLIHLGNQEE